MLVHTTQHLCHLAKHWACHVVKRGGRRWKNGGREEWRLRNELGDLGGRRELRGFIA